MYAWLWHAQYTAASTTYCATKGQQHVSMYAIYLSYHVLNSLKCMKVAQPKRQVTSTDDDDDDVSGRREDEFISL